ncbi:hypothetical protein Psesu_2602 [Pseudoxanthomonas suwonensis 11-1]|uniref:DUF4410 domain-containing protein n=1 Tax=Pseudoxanthomonas suwonensis (strain 11-1) TaxID=743721 RepID=E6WWF7_PSEUU|nr:DUF4410 domain-containing protein [Pseudoxanthomonas suwonensis]ADV28434.1 hypothetical protein Psesu_2602 [Pseudoxanthomonas suwonensis 11-1]
MRVLVLIAVVLLAACSTTSRVHQAHSGLQGKTFDYRLVDRGGDNAEGVAELDRVIRNRLFSAGLVDQGASAGAVEVTVTHYYVRHGAARALVGIMAGRDKIISHVRVLDPAGAVLASFEVESTNATAWGTTGGLHEKHADEILAQLKRQ